MGLMGSREMTVICSLFLVGSCGGASRTIEDLIMGKDSCDLLRPIKYYFELYSKEDILCQGFVFDAHANIFESGSASSLVAINHIGQ